LLADHARLCRNVQAALVCRLETPLAAAALCGLVVASVLAGVALMLWSVMPAVQPSWILIATPTVPAVLAACCLVALRRQYRDAAAQNLWQQIKADLQVLRTAAVA
jgi:hypothetical protein